MALSDRTKKFAIVITLKGIDYGELLEIGHKLECVLNAWNSPRWAFILHDMDINEYGEKKTPHYHLYMETEKVTRVSTIINQLAKRLELDTLAISCDKCNSTEGAIQYLIHLNDKDKYQYGLEEVKSNIEIDELSLIMSRPSHTFNADYILYEWEQSDYNLRVFINAIGIERYRLYRNTIRDLIGLR